MKCDVEKWINQITTKQLFIDNFTQWIKKSKQYDCYRWKCLRTTTYYGIPDREYAVE